MDRRTDERADKWITALLNARPYVGWRNNNNSHFKQFIELIYILPT